MIIFFDTSALVRRYHHIEPGAQAVRRLCLRANQNDLVILNITSIEVASAFNRALREGRIDIEHRDRLWRLFLAHRRVQYRVVQFDARIARRAQQLLFSHPIRAYDAVQIAGALQVVHTLASGVELRFCTADRAQARAAGAEGLSIEFIL